MNKSWIFVILTCTFELLWVYGFNAASGWWQWGIVITIIVVDFIFLSKACEGLPTGTVYAMFSAVGTVGASLMDIFIFNAHFTAAKTFFIILLVIGVVSLKLADSYEEEAA